MYLSKATSLFIAGLAAPVWSFAPVANRHTVVGHQQESTFLSMAIAKDDTEVEEGTFDALSKVKSLFKSAPAKTKYDGKITSIFKGALSNKELEVTVVEALAEKGFTSENTLLATSLCCDELARQLESDFVKVYGKNFNLGGLSGFPFAGNTGFGASK